MSTGSKTFLLRSQILTLYIIVLKVMGICDNTTKVRKLERIERNHFTILSVLFKSMWLTSFVLPCTVFQIRIIHSWIIQTRIRLLYQLETRQNYRQYVVFYYKVPSPSFDRFLDSAGSIKTSLLTKPISICISNKPFTGLDHL